MTGNDEKKSSVEKLTDVFLEEISDDESCHAAEFDKKAGCSGIELGKYHDGYFGKEEIASVFGDAIMEIVDEIPDKPVILGIGSGPGLPEILVKRLLEDHGKIPTLILSDKIEEAMGKHYEGFEPGENTEKRVFDNKNMSIEDGTIDIVIARSSIHYERRNKYRIKILEEVKRVLKKGGVFLNQELAISSQEEALFVKKERALAGKYASYITVEEEHKMYDTVFGKENVRLAKVQPSPLYDDAKNFCERFKIPDEKRKKMIKKIIGYITKKNIRNMPNIILEKNAGFRHIRPFQLIVAKKQKVENV
jgi:SAM-dependent methyltransferase